MQIIFFCTFFTCILPKNLRLCLYMKKAAVIGFPVKHSLSPRLHGFWLDKYKIAGEYTAIEIPPEGLSEFISTMAENGYCGVNVTVPHKEKVMELLDDVEHLAQEVGAVNTIVVKDGKLIGRNTDVYGFKENIKLRITGTKKAVVLGAGGAARAVIFALYNIGFKQIIITNRTKERAEELAQDFPFLQTSDWQSRSAILQDADLLVNTTSLGMSSCGTQSVSAGSQQVEQDPVQPNLQNLASQDDKIIDLSLLPKTALVTDIVYNPLITPLLEQAKARGNPIVDGLGMLLHQAVPAFEAWFGETPVVDDELRQYILQGL